MNFWKWFLKNLKVQQWYYHFECKHDQPIEDDLCILKEIGWVDDDLAAINETIVEDMNSFPDNISAALTGEEFDQCMEKVESVGPKSGK